EATVQGMVRKVDVKYTRRRGMAITQVIVEDETGTVRAVWFNQPYLANAFRPGRLVHLAGKLSISDEGELYLNNPAHEFIHENRAGDGEDSYHTGRLVPIYPK